MKKLLIYIGLFLLGGLLFYVINLLTSASQTQIPPAQAEEAPVQQSSYYAGRPVIGPDLTDAANKTVDAVVHIRSQFSTKSQGYDDFYGALREYLGYERRPERSYPIS